MNTDGTAAGNNLLQDRKAAEPRAIIVVSIGDQHQSIYSQTRRSIEQYARRIGAALLNIDSVGVLPTDLVQSCAPALMPASASHCHMWRSVGQFTTLSAASSVLLCWIPVVSYKTNVPTYSNWFLLVRLVDGMNLR